MIQSTKPSPTFRALVYLVDLSIDILRCSDQVTPRILIEKKREVQF